MLALKRMHRFVLKRFRLDVYLTFFKCYYLIQKVQKTFKSHNVCKIKTCFLNILLTKKTKCFWNIHNANVSKTNLFLCAVLMSVSVSACRRLSWTGTCCALSPWSWAFCRGWPTWACPSMSSHRCRRCWSGCPPSRDSAWLEIKCRCWRYRPSVCWRSSTSTSGEHKHITRTAH